MCLILCCIWLLFILCGLLGLIDDCVWLLNLGFADCGDCYFVCWLWSWCGLVYLLFLMFGYLVLVYCYLFGYCLVVCCGLFWLVAGCGWFA